MSMATESSQTVILRLSSRNCQSSAGQFTTFLSAEKVVLSTVCVSYNSEIWRSAVGSCRKGGKTNKREWTHEDGETAGRLGVPRPTTIFVRNSLYVMPGRFWF